MPAIENPKFKFQTSAFPDLQENKRVSTTQCLPSFYWQPFKTHTHTHNTHPCSTYEDVWTRWKEEMARSNHKVAETSTNKKLNSFSNSSS